jgi:type IV secretory pathway component VirB8
MVDAVTDLESKTVGNAKRQFVELYGSALAHNAFLRVIVALSVVINLALVGSVYWLLNAYGDVEPLVIRVDPEGRAETGRFDASQYTPNAAEARYFLTRFTILHFSRNRSRVQTEYPDSLFFLGPDVPRDRRDVETFTSNPIADEVDVVVTRTILRQFQQPPFTAEVTFERVFLTPGARQERLRQTYIAQVEFDRLKEVPTSFVRVNPLGFQIRYLHVDEVFEETKP